MSIKFYNNIKIYNSLYIFFIILFAFFVEFSTNLALSKNYNVSNVEIEETYDLNFERTQVIEYGFEKAFKKLIYRLIEKKDRLKFENTSLQQIKILINNFSVSEEKFVDNKYKSLLEVEFNKKKILEFIKLNKIQPSIPLQIDTLIIPIMIDKNKDQIFYLSQNILYEKWNKNLRDYFLIKYHFPNEDIEDLVLIKNNINNIENFNFDEILKKYNFNNHIIFILFIEGSKVNIFSRFSLKDNEFLLNKKIMKFELNNYNIENLIFNSQETFEDLWKSENKINDSIKININLKIDSNNYFLSKKLEKIFNDFELINSFEIKSINNKNIIYKITYNGLPDKLNQYLISKGFEIDNSNDIWELK